MRLAILLLLAQVGRVANWQRGLPIHTHGRPGRALAVAGLGRPGGSLLRTEPLAARRSGEGAEGKSTAGADGRAGRRGKQAGEGAQAGEKGTGQRAAGKATDGQGRRPGGQRDDPPRAQDGGGKRHKGSGPAQKRRQRPRAHTKNAEGPRGRGRQDVLRALQNELKAAETLDDVFSALAPHRRSGYARLRAVHLSTAMHRLGKLPGRAAELTPAERVRVLNTMKALSARLLDPAVLGSVIPLGISNVLWACARRRWYNEDLLNALCARACEEEVLALCNAQTVANTLWALAKLQHRAEPTVLRIAGRFTDAEVLGSCKPQEASNSMWALAKLGVKAPDVMSALSEHLMSDALLLRCNGQEIANTLYAHATLRTRNERLFSVFGERVMEPSVLPNVKAQEAKDVLWSHATLNIRNDALFDRLSRHIQTPRVLRRMKVQEISNTLWSFATLRKRDGALFKALGAQLMRPNVLSAADVRGASLVLWSLATLNWDLASDREARELVHRLLSIGEAPEAFAGASEQTASITVWSQARLNVVNVDVFRAVGAWLSDSGASARLSGRACAAILWAHGRIEESDLPTDDRLYSDIGRRVIAPEVLRSLAPRSIAHVLWSHARRGFVNAPLFAALCERMCEPSCLEAAGSQDIASVLWAIARLELRVPRAQWDLLVEALVGRAESNVVELVNAVWAHARLDDADGQRLLDRVAPRLASGGMALTGRECFAQNSAYLWSCAVFATFESRAGGLALAILLGSTAEEGRLGELMHTQLHQFFLTMDQLGVGDDALLRAAQAAREAHPALDALPAPTAGGLGELRATARSVSAAVSSGGGSNFQSDVRATLQRLGVRFEEEFVLERLGYSVDLWLPDRAIGIEVDGPVHFLMPLELLPQQGTTREQLARPPSKAAIPGGELKPTGRTVLKRRNLRDAGVEIRSIAYYDWQTLTTPREKDAFLQSAIGIGG